MRLIFIYSILACSACIIVLLYSYWKQKTNLSLRTCFQAPLINIKYIKVRIPRMHALIMIGALLCNAFFMLLPSSKAFGHAFTQSTGAIALTNIALLATDLQERAERVGISQTTYKSIHRLIERLMFLQTLLHLLASLFVPSYSKSQIWTGILALISILLFIAYSFVFIRAKIGRVSPIVHQAFGVMLSTWLILHCAWPDLVASIILAIYALIVQVATILINMQTYYFNLTTFTASFETHSHTKCLKLHAILERAVSIFPGSYFYLYCPSDSRRYAVTPFSYDYQADPQMTSRIIFLISASDCPGLWDFIQETCELSSEKSKRVELYIRGPLGRDLGLERQDNVFLVAKGLGICAVLHAAHSLNIRYHHNLRVSEAISKKREYLITLEDRILEDQNLEGRQSLMEEKKLVNRKLDELGRLPHYRVATKKVNIYWQLEDNSQLEVALEELEALYLHDESSAFIVTWISFPDHIERSSLLGSPYWIYLDPRNSDHHSLLGERLRHKRSTEDGQMIVFTCGDQDFSDEIRDLVQAASDSYGIKLLVSDYILGTPTKSSKLKSMPSLSIEVPGAVR